MSRALQHWAERVSVALVGMACAVLAVILPVLSTSAADPAGPGVAVLALAVAVLFAVGTRLVSFPTGCAAKPRPAADAGPPVLPGRVTDPLHHPLRPRAPGLA